VEAFNVRAKEMDVPLLKLALFLDPRYRQAAIQGAARSSAATNASSSGDGGGGGSISILSLGLAALKIEAGKLAQKLGYSMQDVTDLYSEMSSYASNKPPYKQQDLTPSSYWVAVLTALPRPSSAAPSRRSVHALMQQWPAARQEAAWQRQLSCQLTWRLTLQPAGRQQQLQAQMVKMRRSS
jgi:hypothetical protein